MSPDTASGRSPLTRPTLVPGLRRLWRGRRRLQLGVDPSRAVVLELPEPSTARVLDLLDGTRSERTVLAEAGRYGVTEPDGRAIIDCLRAAGLVLSAQALLPSQFPDQVRRRLGAEAAALALDRRDGGTTPAQILRRRAAARIAVTGDGPLAEPVAVALARAGIGHVAPMLDNPTHMRQASQSVARQAPGARTAALSRREVTFEVQVGDGPPAVLAAAGYARRRLAHLAISLRDGTAVVGPLVPPTGGPCLNCLDLHRRERDPEWPALAAQLAAAPGFTACAVTTALIATGLATSEVLSWIDGATPTTVGASIEVSGSSRLRQRSWPPHPACRCARRSRRGQWAGERRIGQ
jgi:hypothetical protein